MKRLLFVILLLVAPATAWGGTVLRPAGCQEVSGSYIVVLEPAIRDSSSLDRESSGRVEKMAEYLSSKWGGTVTSMWSRALQGFAVQSAQESAVESMADEKGVAYVQQNCRVYADADQLNPPSWGLDRIDQRQLPLDDRFHYDGAGAGAHLYILDTGIRTTHNELAGRIGNGYSFYSGGVEDCDGHGTHVAGTAAGSSYGVAKQATVHPVRVLACDGGGSTESVVGGVEWVTVHHADPAVANMSLSGGPNPAIDDAVRGSIAAGVTYVVAAGNNYGQSACGRSPARVAQALTVAASDINDQAADFTNCGSCVDLVAPGVSITSAWYTGNNASNTISGTSMSSPHVAGVAAVYAAAVGGTPAQIGQAILGATTPNQISGLCSGTPNLLLYSDFLAGDAPPTASFTFSCSGLTCSFDGRASSDDQGIASYSWSFGDGSSGNGSQVSHTYASGGARTVTLTVTDTSGQSDSHSRQVSPCGDSVPPSVSITAPADGDFVWGDLTIRANASDASGISRVELRVNNSLRCTDTSAPYSCTIDVDDFNSGLKNLRARAYDSCGNNRQVSIEAFFVSNPLAALDTPAEGATVQGDAVRLSGWASDPDGIADVRFEVDGAPLALNGPVTYGLSRPDACSAVPLSDPSCPDIGFEAYFDSRLLSDGPHSLQVVSVDADGRTTRTPTPARQIVVEQPPPDPCTAGPNTLCLMGNRFEVEASFVQNGIATPARARTGSGRSGYFWFFNSQNLEIGVKVLDGTGSNGHYWVFHGGLTSLEYTLRVTDTQTGDVQTYVKPSGSFCGDPDTQAFPAAAGFAGTSGKSFELVDAGSALLADGSAPTAIPAGPARLRSGLTSTSAASTPCVPGPSTICLLNDRFQVQVRRGGSLQPALGLTDETGAFWFFQSSNTEVIVKVLDGTGFNGHYWVFLGSLTDQPYTATVTDTLTGAVWSHVNPAGTYCGAADTAAF